MLTSRWILFADADTRFEPGFLKSVVAAAEADKIDFLSVYLRPEYRTLWESTLSPYGVALYFCAINARADPAAAFNGQCVLVSRAAYEFIGGHKAVLGDVCEDLKMAALAQRHRMKVAVMRAPRLGRVHIRPVDFVRNAKRFAQLKLWRGISVVLAAVAWTLWLPVLVILFARHQFAAAIAWAWCRACCSFPGMDGRGRFWPPWASTRSYPTCCVALLAQPQDATWSGRVV